MKKINRYKFRVWDTKSKEMAYPLGSLAGSTDEGFSHLYQRLETKNKFGPNEIFNENDIIIMQFTGLIDKNKNDIYEGDILFWPNRQMEIEVKFDKFKFYLRDTVGGYEEDLNLHFPFEIIGNIYEKNNIISKLEHIKIDYMSCYFFKCPKCDAITETHINHIYCQKCNEKPYKEIKIEQNKCPICDDKEFLNKIEEKFWSCPKCQDKNKEKSAPKKIYKYNHRPECKQEYNPYCTCDGCCEERTDKKTIPRKVLSLIYLL